MAPRNQNFKGVIKGFTTLYTGYCNFKNIIETKLLYEVNMCAHDQ